MFDRNQEAIIGTTDFDIMPEELAATIKANDQKIIEDGVAQVFEEKIQ